MPDRERKRVADDRSEVLIRSPQESTPAHPWDTKKSEYLRMNEENEKENKDEATQRGIEELYQRQCGSR